MDRREYVMSDNGDEVGVLDEMLVEKKSQRDSVPKSSDYL